MNHTRFAKTDPYAERRGLSDTEAEREIRGSETRVGNFAGGILLGAGSVGAVASRLIYLSLVRLILAFTPKVVGHIPPYPYRARWTTISHSRHTTRLIHRVRAGIRTEAEIVPRCLPSPTS